MDRRGFIRMAMGAIGIAQTMGVSSILLEPVKKKLTSSISLDFLVGNIVEGKVVLNIDQAGMLTVGLEKGHQLFSIPLAGELKDQIIEAFEHAKTYQNS